MWIDTHAHLADISDAEFMKKLESAKSAGVAGVINIGTDLAESKTVVERSFWDTPVKTFAVAGICVPESANFADDGEWIKILEETASSKNVVAIGETGIDGAEKNGYPPIEKQMVVFEKQIDLAKKLNKPVVVHSRMLDEKAFEICVSAGVEKALFHCFTGNKETAKKICDRGYFVSFSGIATFKNGGLDDAIKAVNIDQMLIETDSPWLAPEPHRGKRNEPAFVSFVGEKMAGILNVDKEKFADITQKNAEKFFKVAF